MALCALFVVPVPAVGQTAAGIQTAQAARFLSVVSTGRLPGFASADVPAYLAEQMAETRLEGWSFDPIHGDFEPPANRVEWSFRAEGDDAGPPTSPWSQKSRFVARRLVVVEVRLFLDGQYQTVTSAADDVYGGPQDGALAALVRRLSESLLGAQGAYQAIDIRRPAAAPAPR